MSQVKRARLAKQLRRQRRRDRLRKERRDAARVLAALAAVSPPTYSISMPGANLHPGQQLRLQSPWTPKGAGIYRVVSVQGETAVVEEVV